VGVIVTHSVEVRIDLYTLTI